MTLSDAREANGIYGVVGFPVHHSLGPLLHNHWFGRFGIPARYYAFEVGKDAVGDFMQAFRLLRLAGGSVTIPHKESVIPFLDRVSDRARDMGAVNTLFRDGDLVCGENTDVEGILRPLRDRGRPCASALILGAGGACRAAIRALQESGVPRIAIANRTRERAVALAETFGLEVVDWEDRTAAGAEVIVNTTPLGMKGELLGESPWPEGAALGSARLVFEAIYNPLETRLVRQAMSQGVAVISGLEMFLNQAAAQFRIWTGREIDLAESDRLLRERLAT